MPADANRCFDDFDFLDFAQEFLRRNAHYQSEFVRLCNGIQPKLESKDFIKIKKKMMSNFSNIIYLDPNQITINRKPGQTNFGTNLLS